MIIEAHPQNNKENEEVSVHDTGVNWDDWPTNELQIIGFHEELRTELLCQSLSCVSALLR